MNITVKPGNVRGCVQVPSSKSIGHRALICAGLSKGRSLIAGLSPSRDITATINGLKQLGICCKLNGHDLMVENKGLPPQQGEGPHPLIDCGESGSTLRFLMPVALALAGEAVFTGTGRLGERPLDVYRELFSSMGITWHQDPGGLPLKVRGSLKSGEYEIDGSISSQFITGLMLALPLLKDTSVLRIKNALESRPYIDLTMEVLKDFGISIINHSYREFIIPGGQNYTTRSYKVEGDFSQAAFFLAAGALSGSVDIKGLKESSFQGDRVIIDILSHMGAEVTWNDDKLHISQASLTGTSIDASQCPDLVPILAVIGSLSKGTTIIKNAGRLRFKESDRLSAMAEELKKLGADIVELKDGLVIHGKPSLSGGVVNSWNDHRVAMSLGVAALRCSSPVAINGADCVDKSYPLFWEDLRRIGGDVVEQHMGK